MSTALDVRKSFDLTRAPAEDWNQEMVNVVQRNVFRGMEITLPQLHYCLTVADSLALNPLIEEIYFLPAKSRDGKGAAWKPYIGRNGLVKKANDRGCYFEAETVHANDSIRIHRRKNGNVEVLHSYNPLEDRGEIKGAYAFLHDVDGRRKPAFFYAKWEEYRPEFDQEWKWDASPWGNQSSAMIEKCAMIGAGRKRLDLGNVLADGEIDRYQQQAAIGPSSAPPADTGEFEFEKVTEDRELAEQLRSATAALGWPAAKCEMVFTGLSDDELWEYAARLGSEAESAPESEPPAAQEATEPESDPEIADAEVLSQIEAERIQHREGLDARKRRLEAQMREAEAEGDEDAQNELALELELVDGEIVAADDPNQTHLDV